MAQNNRNNRNRSQPSQNAGNKQRRGSSVPPLDAFNKVDRLPPPTNVAAAPLTPAEQQALNGWEDARPTQQKRGQGKKKGTGQKKHSGKATQKNKKKTPAGKNPTEAKGGGQRAQGKPGTTPVKAKNPRKKTKPKRKKRPLTPARRRRRIRIAMILGVLMLVAVGIWFSFEVLFKIETFEVQGESPYSDAEILSVFGHEEGENMLFAFRAGPSAQELEEKLPYLQSVKVRRSLPGTIVFEVTGAKEGYYLEWNGAYAVLSTQLKVLRVVEEQPEALTRLYGLTGLVVKPGFALALDEDAADEVENIPVPADDKPEPESPVPSEPEGIDDPNGNDDPNVSGEGADGSSAPAGDADGEARGEGMDGDEGASGGEADNQTDPEGQADPDAGDEPPAGEPESDPDDQNTPEDDTPDEPGEPDEPEDIAYATHQERFDAMLGLLDALGAEGFTDITWINVADILNMEFRWEDRITVLLGARSGLAEKLAMAKVLLTDREQSDITESDRGSLDVSAYLTTLEGWFLPE